MYSAQLIRTRMATLASNSWVVLTGDFNMPPTDPAYAALLGANDPQGVQIRDAYRQVHPVEQPDELTRHNFTGGTTGKRIDYVFHTGEFAASAATIVHTSYDGGRYPSDHYPVTATLNTEALQPMLLAVAAGSGGVELIWSSVSGLPYRVSSSTDLLAWQGVFPAAGSYLATGSESRCSVPCAGDPARAFYRVIGRPGD